jgi:hypothetical protein
VKFQRISALPVAILFLLGAMLVMTGCQKSDDLPPSALDSTPEQKAAAKRAEERAKQPRGGVNGAAPTSAIEMGRRESGH